MRGIVSILLTLALSACAIPVRVTPEPAPGQEIIYRDGRQTLMSEKAHAVMVAPEFTRFEVKPNGEGRGRFVVAVQNRMDKKIDVGPNIVDVDCHLTKVVKKSGSKAEDKTFSFADLKSVFGVGEANAAAPQEPEKDLVETVVTREHLKVFTYEELLREEESRQAVQAFAAALAGVSRSMQAQNAGYTYHQGTYRGRQYSGYSYNPQAQMAAQQAAEAQTDADFARIKAEGQARQAQLGHQILKRTTVMPGDLAGGIVVVSLPEPADTPIPVDFTIDLGDEEHTFRYRYEKVKR